MARPTAKQGVEFICKVLGVYGVDYLDAESFRLAKDDDPSVTEAFSKLCVDTLTLLISDCKHALRQPRDYEGSEAHIRDACDAFGMPFSGNEGSRSLLTISLLFLSQFGSKFIDGYRDLALAECGFASQLPRVDSYRSKAINRLAAEQASAAALQLSKIKNVNASHVIQVMRKRKALMQQLEDLQAEALKMAKRQGIRVGEWLRTQDRKGEDYFEQDIAIQKEAIAEVAFWVWVESVGINFKPSKPRDQKSAPLPRVNRRQPDLGKISKIVESCLDKIEASGLHARPTNQFMTR